MAPALKLAVLALPLLLSGASQARAAPPAALTWLDWGAPAFERARREGRPLVVRVTAFGCWPCQALEREVLDDALLARALERRVVAVRVDAGELPQVADALALAARDRGAPAALPLLVTLAADGRLLEVAPVPGPGDREAAARLARWLERTHEPAARGAAGHPASPPGPGETFTGSAPAGATSAAAAGGSDPIEALAALPLPDEADEEPLTPPALPALRARLEELGAAGTPEAARAADRRLEQAARSAYRDHVGGGFHRGRLPGGSPVMRYEKRLADNALWLRAFARGYAATGNLLHRDVAQEVVAWAIREMRDATGAFWGTVDAASGGQDGAFYRFSREELTAALGADRGRELLGVYELAPPGLLVLRGSPFAGLGSSLQVLRSRRARRIRPAPDERILAGWNGLFVGALAVSGRRLQRGSDLEAARRAAETVLARLGPPGRLKHSTSGSAAAALAGLADYAYLAEGLLDLEAATDERRWREAAVALVDAALMRLWDTSRGGFRTGGPATPVPPEPALHTARDVELPSPNGVMASVLVRLGGLTGAPRYERLARRTLEAFAGEAARDPAAAATLIVAARAYLRARGSAPTDGARRTDGPQEQ